MTIAIALTGANRAGCGVTTRVALTFAISCATACADEDNLFAKHAPGATSLSLHAHGKPAWAISLPGTVAWQWTRLRHDAAAWPFAFRSLRLPLTRRVIHRVAGRNPRTGTLDGVCFDGTGNELVDCGQRLRNREIRARRAIRGAMTDEMIERIAALSPSEVTNVGIWLAMQFDFPRREEFIGDEVVALQEAIAQSHAALLAQLPTDIASRLVLVPGAPAAYGALTRAEIVYVSRLAAVALLAPHDLNEPLGSVWVDAVLANTTGFQGAGVDVCVVEATQPTGTTDVPFSESYCGTGTVNVHANQVASVIRKNTPLTGDAPSANLHVASWTGCDPNAVGALNWCATQGYPVWNFSHTANGLDDRLFDFWSTVPPFASIAVAAGNNNDIFGVLCGTACPPNYNPVSTKSYNAITVGAANDCGTTTRADDEMACFSNGNNPDYGRELPLVSAPGQSMTIDQGAIESGTSLASPAIASTAAQLIEANPGISGWPEAIRSIVMTGADEVVEPDRMLSLEDPAGDQWGGAGELNVQRSLNIGLGSNRFAGTPLARGHDYETLFDTMGLWTFYPVTYRALSTTGGRFRSVLTWDYITTCHNVSDPDQAWCDGITPLNSIFWMLVTDTTTGAQWSSDSIYNNYQIVEFEAQPGVEYNIQFYAVQFEVSSTYFGISWNIQ